MVRHFELCFKACLDRKSLAAIVFEILAFDLRYLCLSCYYEMELLTAQVDHQVLRCNRAIFSATD